MSLNQTPRNCQRRSQSCLSPPGTILDVVNRRKVIQDTGLRPRTERTRSSTSMGRSSNHRWCAPVLSGNTRPDIALAVSQVCRFASAPKKPQVSAAKTILRCLKKTMDKGLIIKPTENPFQLDLHVDADFCGLFGQEVECEVKGWMHCEIRRMACHLEVSTSVSHLPECTRS